MKEINEPQGDENQRNFLSGGSELAKLISSYDWSKTSLGTLESWPQYLKTSVSIILQSPVPLIMLWGSDGIMIYNDAYSVFAGARHPGQLGSKVVDGWPEVADFNRNVLQNCLAGKTLSYHNQQLTLYRNNVPEEVWMDLNYSPILDECGKPAGVLAIVIETTQKVLAEQKQKQAEEALSKREEHLRALITATSDIIYTMNADWSEMGVLQGRVFVPDTGMPNKDWFEKNIPPSDQNTVRKAINEAIINKSVFQLEHRVRLADGGIGWTFSRAIPILNSDGAIVEWLGAASDVTERKQVEEALKESEGRFRTIADDAPVFLFLAGVNAEVEYLNKTWREYTGISADDSKGRAWAEITHPDDVEPATKIYMDGFTKRESCTFENRQKGTDETYRTILWKATPRFSPSGDFIGMMGVGLDINERKEAEEALKESEQRLRAIADNIPNLAWMAEADGSIFWYNKRWYDYTGTTPEEMAGWGWQSVHHENALSSVMTRWKESIDTGNVFEMAFPLKGADNVFRQFLTRVIPIKDENGNVIRWFGTNTDIDEQKKLEQDLQEAAKQLAAANEEVMAGNEELITNIEDLSVANQKLVTVNRDLDNFIYIASHDLKAPIANIEGLMNGLNRAIAPEEKIKIEKFIDLIEASILRFKKTVESLTEVAKLQKQEDVVQSINFLEILDEVKLDLDTIIDQSHAKFEIENCSLNLTFSYQNFKSIIYNLISNAIKYRSPERSPVIKIKCYQEDEFKVIVFEDNGLGMDDSNKSSIFGMFKRLHRHVEGTGIGLYIVKKIIEDNGGKIEVNSKIGVGSTFKVYFKEREKFKNMETYQL